MTDQDRVGASTPSAFGGTFDLQDFYRGFRREEITPQNMQRWPYYSYVSARWGEFCQTAIVPIKSSRIPAVLEAGERFDLSAEFRGGTTYLQSLINTQVKGFVVLRDGKLLAEFYDNGFNLGDLNLLQSASKTLTGVVMHRLADAGMLDLDVTVHDVLSDFAGTTIGAATVQQVLDMTSGARTLLDFHTPGSRDQQWEVEVGLQAGTRTGHVGAIKAAVKAAAPGTTWNYNDKNTDALALIAERSSGRRFVDLLEDLFDDFGANDAGSIVVTDDGTASPCYGISMTTRDYALFHQWVAQRSAPTSYYASAMDASKNLITTTNPLAAQVFAGTTYGSQTYYMVDDDILHSSGSFGQIAMSDMETGTVVAMHADWANNAVLDQFEESRSRAVSVIDALR
jgi:CubicO group peptidase (beta-lactamase class C family)